jgi:hypothetical protein
MTALWAFDTKTGGPLPDDDTELLAVLLAVFFVFILMAFVGGN